MRKEIVLAHEFVEFIPDDLKERTIYVSIRYATAAHRCCCGCGKEVVTPLSPTDWKLIFDGKTISLDPSIGNWSFECQSHYWIRNNRVRWAARWSQDEIDSGRAHDRFAKARYFGPADSTTDSVASDKSGRMEKGKAEKGFWQKLKKWWLYGRDDDRRSEVQRPDPARRGNRGPASHLRPRLPGPHRPAPGLRGDLRARRA